METETHDAVLGDGPLRPTLPSRLPLPLVDLPPLLAPDLSLMLVV